MGLPLIYTQPRSDEEWQAWAFNHAANHYDIVNAIFDQKKQNLSIFPLDPMDFDNLGNWSYWHQEMHNAANAVLGTSGFDLLSLDWDDPDEFAVWLRMNGSEHVRLSAALGIG
jgi:hypothetical protein